MISKPLVSLVLCVKNGMPYLPEAVASVADQSYPNFELIVQDGGSTDGSLEFLQVFKGIINLQIESRSDRGIGQAYDRAFARCHGELVGSIDADNLLEKDALVIVVKRFSEHPDCAAIYGASHMIDAASQVISTWVPPAFDLIRVMECEVVPPFGMSFLSRNVCDAELRFDEGLKTCGDFDLWLRIGHLPILMIPDVIGRTRLSDRSMTRDPGAYDQFCKDKITALERYMARYERNLLTENIYRHAVAGIYVWAAASIRELEGQSIRFEQYCERAAVLDPHSPRLKALRDSGV